MVAAHMHKKTNSLTKKKLSILQKGENNSMFGRKHSSIARKKMILHHKGMIGLKHTKETRKQQRLARLKNIAIYKNCGQQTTPSIGTHEIKILNYIETINNVKLKRQHKIDGYFLDGYCIETNTVYEVDEADHHSEKNKLRDKEREEYIKDKLNCKFIRLNEKEYLEKLKAL